MAKLAKTRDGWILVLGDRRIPLPQKRFPPAWDFLDIMAEVFKLRPELSEILLESK